MKQILLLAATAQLIAYVAASTLPAGAYCSVEGFGLVVKGGAMYGSCASYNSFGYNYTWDTNTNQVLATGSSSCYFAALRYSPSAQAIVANVRSTSLITYTLGACLSSNATTPPSGQAMCSSQGTVTLANTFFVTTTSTGTATCWGVLSPTSIARSGPCTTTATTTTASLMTSYSWSFDSATFGFAMSTYYYTTPSTFLRYTAAACTNPKPAAIVPSRPYCTQGYNAVQPQQGPLNVVFFDDGWFTMNFLNTQSTSSYMYSACTAIGQFWSLSPANIEINLQVYPSTYYCTMASITSGFSYDSVNDVVSVTLGSWGNYSLGNCGNLPAPVVPSGSYCAGSNAAMVIAGYSIAVRVATGAVAVGQYTFSNSTNTTTIYVATTGATMTTFSGLGVNSDGTFSLQYGRAYSYSTMNQYDMTSYSFSAAQCSLTPARPAAATYWMTSTYPRASFSGPLTFNADGTFVWILNGSYTTSCISSGYLVGTAIARGTKISLRGTAFGSAGCTYSFLPWDLTLSSSGVLSCSYAPVPYNNIVTMATSTTAPAAPTAIVPNGLYCLSPKENMTVTNNWYLWQRADQTSSLGYFLSSSAVQTVALSLQSAINWVPSFIDTTSTSGTIFLSGSTRYSITTSYIVGYLSTVALSTGSCGSATAALPVPASGYCATGVLNGTLTITFAGGNFAAVYERAGITYSITGTAWYAPATGAVSLTSPLSAFSSSPFTWSSSFILRSLSWSSSKGLTVTFADISGAQTVTMQGCSSNAGGIASGVYCADPGLVLGAASPPQIIVAGSWMSVYNATPDTYYTARFSALSNAPNVSWTSTFTPTLATYYNFTVNTDGNNLRFNRAQFTGSYPSDFLSVAMTPGFCTATSTTAPQKAFLVSNELLSNMSATVTLDYNTFAFTFFASPTTACLFQGTYSVQSASTQASIYYAASSSSSYYVCGQTFISNLQYSVTGGTGSIELWFAGSRNYFTFGGSSSSCASTGALTATQPWCTLKSTVTLYSCSGYYAITTLTGSTTVGTVTTSSLVVEFGTLSANFNGTVTVASAAGVGQSLITFSGAEALVSQFSINRLAVLTTQSCSAATVSAATVMTNYATSQATQYIPVGSYSGYRPVYTAGDLSDTLINVASLPSNKIVMTYVPPGSYSTCAFTASVVEVQSSGDLSLAAFSGYCYYYSNVVVLRLFSMNFNSAKSSFSVSAAYYTPTGAVMSANFAVNTTTSNALYGTYAYNSYSLPGQGLYTATTLNYQFTAVTFGNFMAYTVQNTATSGNIVSAGQLFNYSGSAPYYYGYVNNAVLLTAYVSPTSQSMYIQTATDDLQVALFVGALTQSPYFVTQRPTPSPPYTIPAVPSPGSPNTPSPWSPYTPSPYIIYPPSTPQPASQGGAAAPPDAPSGLSGGNGAAVGIVCVVAAVGLIGGGIFVFMARQAAAQAVGVAAHGGAVQMSTMPATHAPGYAPPQTAYRSL